MNIYSKKQSAAGCAPRTAAMPNDAAAGSARPTGLFDTHCHLDLPVFDPDRESVLRRARAAGVRHLLVPGITAGGWERIRALCAGDPGLHAAYGLHPLFMEAHGEGDLRALERLVAEDPLVAIGEIGLDFHQRDADREAQTRLFEQQLAIARDAGLPVVLHVRKAHDQVLQCLRRARVRGGIAHAFSGSLEQARRYIDLGFRLGFGGMLTYERSRRLHALAQALPLSALVLETDAPDMTVAAHHGERNSPEYLPDCLAALAAQRSEPAAEIARRTTQNAFEVFGLSRMKLQ